MHSLLGTKIFFYIVDNNRGKSDDEEPEEVHVEDTELYQGQKWCIVYYA